MRGILIGLVMIVTVLMVACDESEAETSERKVQDSNYERLVEMEPAKEVTNAKTRETVNFFTETWNEEGQLAYVYLQNSDGDMIGYYALDGPPVSMCTALTSPDKVRGTDSKAVVQAPGIDGVYRSDEDCSRYYGKDASTGSYVEFTVGMGINMLLYTEPLSNTGAINLAPAGDSKGE